MSLKVDQLQVVNTTKDTLGKIHVIVDGKEISREQLIALRAEVELLKKFQIWSILQETVKQKAIELGVKNSTNWNDTLAAKMMLHNIGIQQSIVDVIDRAHVPDSWSFKQHKKYWALTNGGIDPFGGLLVYPQYSNRSPHGLILSLWEDLFIFLNGNVAPPIAINKYGTN